MEVDPVTENKPTVSSKPAISVEHHPTNSSSAVNLDGTEPSSCRHGYKEAVCMVCGKIGHLSDGCPQYLDTGKKPKIPKDSVATEVHHSQESKCAVEIPMTENTSDCKRPLNEPKSEWLSLISKGDFKTEQSKSSISVDLTTCPRASSSKPPDSYPVLTNTTVNVLPPLHLNLSGTQISASDSATSSAVSKASPIPARKKIPLLPKTKKPSLVSRKIKTSANVAYFDFSLPAEESSQVVEEDQESSNLSSTCTTNNSSLTCSVEDKMIEHYSTSTSVHTQQDMEITASKSDEISDGNMAGMNKDENMSSCSGGQITNLSPGNSSFLVSEEDTPPSILPIKALQIPKKSKKKKTRRHGIISDLMSTSGFTQVSSSSSEDKPPMYFKIGRPPSGISRNIHTKANIAYMDFNLLTKENSKSLENLESSSESTPALTFKDKVRRHSFDESIGYVDLSPPVSLRTAKHVRTQKKFQMVDRVRSKKMKVPPLPPRLHLETSDGRLNDFYKSSSNPSSLQSLNVPAPNPTDLINEREDIAPLKELESSKESFIHSYERLDRITIGQHTGELPEQCRKSVLSSNSEDAFSSTDESSPTADAASHTPSSSLKRKSSLRRTGSKLSSMLTKLNKTVQDNTKKIVTSAKGHLTAVTIPKFRRQRTVIEKYRFPGELGYGIRVKKPVGPRDEPQHWKHKEILLHDHRFRI